jgi:hypothetical protein
MYPFIKHILLYSDRILKCTFASLAYFGPFSKHCNRRLAAFTTAVRGKIPCSLVTRSRQHRRSKPHGGIV